MDTKGHNGKQRDHPAPECEEVKRAQFRNRLAHWIESWGPDLLMVCGAVYTAAGLGWIYPPVGLIAAGVFLIVGGVLWARGKGGDEP